MIFVTVGGQLPFDRLIRTVDEWARRAGREDVFAQIGGGGYEPRHIEWTRFLNPLDFRRRASDSEFLVAHAGIGSMITALEVSRPIVILPRRAELREHRNDHQLATAERFRGRSGILVADDESRLVTALEGLARLSREGATEDGTGVPHPSARLLDALQRFVTTGQSVREG